MERKSFGAVIVGITGGVDQFDTRVESAFPIISRFDTTHSKPFVPSL